MTPTERENNNETVRLLSRGFCRKIAISPEPRLRSAHGAPVRSLPELFCGLKRRPNEAPTLYPVACSPQAWASAAPFLVLEGCLGISVQAERGRIAFDRPFLPEGISQLAIRGLRCGKVQVNLLLERRNDSVLVHLENKQEEIEIVTIVS